MQKLKRASSGSVEDKFIVEKEKIGLVPENGAHNISSEESDGSDKDEESLIHQASYSLAK